MKNFKITLYAAMMAWLLVGCAATPVTERKQLLLVSEEQAISSSVPAYYSMLSKPKKEGKLDNDAQLIRRVEQMTGRLIAQAILLRPETAGWDWSIHVIDDAETVNAWAMAGGRMAVYSGLVEKIQPSDDELAQVLGHEISHALAKHTAERMSVALATNLMLTAIAIGTDNQYALQGASLAAVLAIQLPNSRTAESEADVIGLELAARAGYDPRAAVTLWQKMNAVDGGARPPEFLSTHPAPGTRMETLNALVHQMMPFYEQSRKMDLPVYQFKPQAQQIPESKSR